MLIASVYQHVRDWKRPLRNVFRFHKTKNVPSFTHGSQHLTEVMMWNRQIALSLCNAALV